MNAKKEKFATEISSYISRICREQLSDDKVPDARVLTVLGINPKELQTILKKIVVALPDYIFLSQLVYYIFGSRRL